MKLLNRITAVLLSLTMLPCVAFADTTEENPFGDADVIYVAPNGSDKGDGSIENPLATMDAARIKAQSKTKSKDVYVVFRGGTYTVRDSVKFGVEDSGTENGKVIYTSYPGEEAVFNGGETVTGWTPYKDGIYVADVKDAENFRELYVDGVRQQRARMYIQAFGFNDSRTAINVLTEDLPEKITHEDCLETLNTYKWRQYWLPVERLFQEGPYTKIYYDSEPIKIYTIKFNFEWDAKSYIALENALEFLDEEGEWYFDKYAKKLYYKPAEGTNINECEVVAPVAQQFIEINGESVSNCVEYLEFRDLKFMYAGWNRTAEEGHLTVQASTMVTSAGAYGEMTPGHIDANFARHLVFTGNTIAYTGITGINLENGVFDSDIIGNAFYDMGFSAVTVGSTKHSATRQAEIPDNIKVNNNYIKFTGSGYSAAAAITLYFTTNSEIIHNHIENTTYTAISLGGCYKKQSLQHDNNVDYNRIYNVNMKVVDGAGIYSMGENRNSTYTGNYISGTNTPFNSGALYHDENSAGFVDFENVIDVENETFMWYDLNNSREILIDNTYTNTQNIIYWKCNDITFTNTHHIENDEWPERALEIMDFSGPTDEYSYVYDKMNTVDKEPRVRKPILSSMDTIYDESNIFMPTYHYAAADEDFKAPYKEENGEVVMNAYEYNGDYVGYEASNNSFVSLVRNEARSKEYYSRAILVTQSLTYPAENKELHTADPEIGYKINFQTPGKYYFYVRSFSGKAKCNDGITIYLDGEKVDSVAMDKTYAWNGKNGNGENVVIDIKEPGVHQIKITTHRSEVYLDRIWITQNPSELLQSGTADLPGPHSSRRDSETATYVDVPIKVYQWEEPAPLQERVNIAVNKPATASSYMIKNGQSYPASKAVNGSAADDWYTEDSQELPWFQVDLEKEYKITEINLVARVLANQATTRRKFEILLSNDPEFKTYTKVYDTGSTSIPFGGDIVVSVDQEETYRYVRVRKTAKEYFGIAELRVYSEENIELDLDNAFYSSDKIGRYGADKAADGDLTTYWSQGFEKNYWMKFKNDSGKGISKVQIYIRDDVVIPELFEDFEVRGSDDKDFEDYEVITSSFEQDGNVLTATMTDPNPYKYVMIIKKSGFVGIAEVKIFARGASLEGEETPETDQSTESN